MGAGHYPQQGISGVVRSRYIVHAILRDQFLESSLRLSLFKQQRVEHRDSLNPQAGAMSFCEKMDSQKRRQKNHLSQQGSSSKPIINLRQGPRKIRIA